MEDKIFEIVVALAGGIYLLLKVGLRSGFSLQALRGSGRDSFTVGVWIVSAVVVWHGIRAAIGVSREIRRELRSPPEPTHYSPILSASGDPISTTEESTSRYSHPCLKIWVMAACLVVIAATASYYAWSKTDVQEAEARAVQDRLQKDQADTFLNLTGGIRLPRSGNPVDSIFTFTNGGPARISRHRIVCRLNFLTYDNGLILQDSTWRLLQDSSVTIDAGGDGESTTCLSNLVSRNRKLACADVTFEYHYSIESQPAEWKIKPFRFAALTSGGSFDWKREPVRLAKSECDTPATAMPDTSQYKRITVCSSGCDYSEIQAALNAATCGTVIYFEQEGAVSNLSAIGKRCTAARQLIIKRSVNALDEADRP